MKTLITLITTSLIAGCGLSSEQQKVIADRTCAIMAETRLLAGYERMREINDARLELGKEPFLGTDQQIQRAMTLGICDMLVLDDPTFNEVLERYEAELAQIAADEQRKEARERAERLAKEKKERDKRMAKARKRLEERGLIPAR